MSEQTRVLVADDHELFRRGVIDALRSSEDFLVEAECATAREAAHLARILLPDLVLLDLGLPDRSGLDLVGEIHRDCPVSRIVVLTVNEDEAAIARALREGASAYILKGVAATELLNALRAVAAGEGYVSPSLAARLLQEIAPSGDPGPLVVLTEREREVLEGIAQGETNREIAERLHLAERTIKYYVTNVLTKLHVRNRVEAALLAARVRRTP